MSFSQLFSPLIKAFTNKPPFQSFSDLWIVATLVLIMVIITLFNAVQPTKTEIVTSYAERATTATGDSMGDSYHSVSYEPSGWLPLLPDDDAITLKVNEIAIDELLLMLAEQNKVNLVIPHPIRKTYTATFNQASSRQIFDVLIRISNLDVETYNKTIIIYANQSSRQNNWQRTNQKNNKNKATIPASINLPPRGF